MGASYCEWLLHIWDRAPCSIALNDWDWELKKLTSNLNHWINKLEVKKTKVKTEEVKLFCEMNESKWIGCNTFDYYIWYICISIHKNDISIIRESISLRRGIQFFYSWKKIGLKEFLLDLAGKKVISVISLNYNR